MSPAIVVVNSLYFVILVHVRAISKVCNNAAAARMRFLATKCRYTCYNILQMQACSAQKNVAALIKIIK